MDMTGYGLCPLAVTAATKALPALLAGTHSTVRSAHCWANSCAPSAVPVIALLNSSDRHSSAKSPGATQLTLMICLTAGRTMFTVSFQAGWWADSSLK